MRRHRARRGDGNSAGPPHDQLAAELLERGLREKVIEDRLVALRPALQPEVGGAALVRGAVEVKGRERGGLCAPDLELLEEVDGGGEGGVAVAANEGRMKMPLQLVVATMHEVEVRDESHLRDDVDQSALRDLRLTPRHHTHHQNQQRQLVIARHLVHQRCASHHPPTLTASQHHALFDLEGQRLQRLPNHVQLPQHAVLIAHALQHPRRASNQVGVEAQRVQAHVLRVKPAVLLLVRRWREKYLNGREDALELDFLQHGVLDQVLHDLRSQKRRSRTLA